MPTFTQTLTDNINCFGPQQSTKYGSPSLYGTSKYGNGGSEWPMLIYIVWRPNSVDTLSITDLTGSITLKDRSGRWSYVFDDSTTNDFNAYIPIYTHVANPSTAWTLQAASSVTWSVST